MRTKAQTQALAAVGLPGNKLKEPERARENARESQRCPERAREHQREPERPRERQREPERAMWSTR